MTDKTAVQLLKCLVGSVALRHNYEIQSEGNAVTLTFSALPSFLKWNKLLPDAGVRVAAKAMFVQCIVRARLDYGIFDLADGECRDQPVGKHFLPMLQYITTDKDGQEWIAALEKHGCDGYDDDRCIGCLADYHEDEDEDEDEDDEDGDEDEDEGEDEEDAEDGVEDKEGEGHALDPTLKSVREALRSPFADWHAAIKEAVRDPNVDMNTRLTKHGQSALAMVAYASHGAQCIRTLVKAGANVNQPDFAGCTPLITAAKYGNLPTVKELCNAGAALDYKPPGSGVTALMEAARNKHIMVVRELLSHGAHPGVVCNHNNYSALNYADQVRATEIASELREATAGRQAAAKAAVRAAPAKKKQRKC